MKRFDIQCGYNFSVTSPVLSATQLVGLSGKSSHCLIMAEEISIQTLLHGYYRESTILNGLKGLFYLHIGYTHINKHLSTKCTVSMNQFLLNKQRP